jgi:hypothetical protein
MGGVTRHVFRDAFEPSQFRSEDITPASESQNRLEFQPRALTTVLTDIRLNPPPPPKENTHTQGFRSG